MHTIDVLSRIFADSPILVGVYRGEELRCVYANDSYTRVLGKHDVIGRTAREIFPEFVDQGTFDLLHDVLETGEAFLGRSVPVRVVDDEGDERVHHFSILYQRIEIAMSPGILAMAFEEPASEAVVGGIGADRRLEEARWRQLEEQRHAREYLQRVFHDAPVALAIYRGPELYIELANARHAALMGTPVDQLLGRSLRDVVDDVASRALVASLPDAMSSGELVARNAIELTLEGEPRFFDQVMQPVAQEEGREQRVMSVTVEVTDMVRAHRHAEELRVSAERASMRLSQLSDAALRLGAQQSHDHLLETLASTARHLLAAKRVLVQLDPAPGREVERRAVSVSEAFAESIGQGQELEAPIQADEARVSGPVRSEPGSALPSSMTAPLVGPNDSVMGVVQATDAENGVFDDDDLAALAQIARFAAVSLAQIDLGEQRMAALGEAERANLLKDEFLAAISHELRTPLNSILGWAQVLGRGDAEEEEAEKAYRIIDRNARGLAILVDDLIDVSRIAAGSFQLRIDDEPVDTADLARQVIESLAPVAAEKDLTVELKEDGSCVVRGDEQRLMQVIQNLMTNAMKFTPRGGHIDVRLECRDDRVVLEVEDDGRGIDEAVLPHIFERFRQAEGGTSRRVGGLGLGLAIVREIVELHAGSVSVTSAGRGKGACFRVVLPSTNAAQPEPGDVGGLRTDLDGLRLLIVDDDEDARILLHAILRSKGAEVTMAAGGAEALEKLDETRFDVLISDIGMPRMDGYGLIRAVRSRPRELGGQVPAVALTAHAAVEDRTRALREGFDIHLAKPVQAAELIEVIASLVRRFRSISDEAADARMRRSGRGP